MRESAGETVTPKTVPQKRISPLLSWFELIAYKYITALQQIIDDCSNYRGKYPSLANTGDFIPFALRESR